MSCLVQATSSWADPDLQQEAASPPHTPTCCHGNGVTPARQRSSAVLMTLWLARAGPMQMCTKKTVEGGAWHFLTLTLHESTGLGPRL